LIIFHLKTSCIKTDKKLRGNEAKLIF